MRIFEILFKLPAEAYARGRLIFRSGLPAEVRLLIAVALAALAWWLYRRVARRVTKRSHRALLGLRVAALVILIRIRHERRHGEELDRLMGLLAHFIEAIEKQKELLNRLVALGKPGSEVRDEAVAALHRAEIAPVDESLALEAADVALEHGLAMADAIIYATARRFGARVITADADFAGLPDATVIR